MGFDTRGDAHAVKKQPCHSSGFKLSLGQTAVRVSDLIIMQLVTTAGTVH